MNRLTIRGRTRIRQAATEYLTWATAIVAESRIIDVARHHQTTPWLDVVALESVLGRDHGQALAEVLANEVPGLTMDGLARRYKLASEYPQALLRAFIALSIVETDRYGDGLRADRRPRVRLVSRGPIAKRCIEEMIDYAARSPRQYRRLAILDWVDASKVHHSTVGDVRLLSPSGQGAFILSDLLPEGHSAALAQHLWLTFRDDTTVLVQEVASDDELFILGVRRDPALAYVTLAIRLLTGGSVRVAGFLLGSPTFVHVEAPIARDFEEASFYVRWNRRAVLTPQDLAGVAELVRAFQDIDGRTEHQGSALGVATRRYTRSFRMSEWQDQVIDLAVGLEAALAGTKNEEVTLTLKTRAASLLAMPGDPPERIFDHVGRLYGMRSNLVHGRPITEGKWSEVWRALGTMDDPLWETRMLTVMDRWRDILRRAILTRLLLERSPRKWTNDGAVDAAISGPASRRAWRREVRSRALSMHLDGALRPVGPLRQTDPS